MEFRRWQVTRLYIMRAFNYILRSSTDADYTIFVWRQQQQPSELESLSTPQHQPPSPTLHLHDPAQPLPTPPAYLNPTYYLFQPSRAHVHGPAHSPRGSPRPNSVRSRKTKGSKHVAGTVDDGVPAFKKQFEKFHGENGVRTVIGSIGPVQNGTYPPLSELTHVVHS